MLAKTVVIVERVMVNKVVKMLDVATDLASGVTYPHMATQKKILLSTYVFWKRLFIPEYSLILNSLLNDATVSTTA